MTEQQLARLIELRTRLGLLHGDYDEFGVNLRSHFNRDPMDAPLWAELDVLEARLMGEELE